MSKQTIVWGALLIAAVACGPSPSHLDGEGPLGSGSGDPQNSWGVRIPVNQDDWGPVFTLGAVALCLYEGAPVELQAARVSNVSGPITIESFGARQINWDQRDIMLISAPGPMPDEFGPLAGYIVDIECAPDAVSIVEVAITSKAGLSENSSWSQLEIDYLDESQVTRTYIFNMSGVACAVDTEACLDPSSSPLASSP